MNTSLQIPWQLYGSGLPSPSAGMLFPLPSLVYLCRNGTSQPSRFFKHLTNSINLESWLRRIRMIDRIESHWKIKEGRMDASSHSSPTKAYLQMQSMLHLCTISQSETWVERIWITHFPQGPSANANQPSSLLTLHKILQTHLIWKSCHCQGNNQCCFSWKVL